MTLDPKDEALLVAAKAKEALWQRGNLRYQLHATQLKILDTLDKKRGKKFFIMCSRRLGKTFLLVNQSIQLCLTKPGARVLYLAPLAKDATEIATDIAGKILEGCPAHLRPEYKAQTKEIIFKNSSIIRIKGVNGETAQYLRGGYADLIVLDECGLMDDLEHVLQDVCMPMTMTTAGRIVLATTPPRSPGHESVTQFEACMGRGNAVVFTIRDAPEEHINLETKIEYLVEAGETEEMARKILAGEAPPTTTTARREYFCEIVTDASSAVVPEFTKELEKQIVVDWQIPPYFDAYVAMDPGFNDRTGIIFGYWDFVSAKFIVQDEVLLDHANTDDIARAILLKERNLWGLKPAYLRISDVDLRLIADLQSLHKLSFMSTRKEDSLGAVNLMRNMLQAKQIIISPKCVNLQRQLRNATWNHKATDFLRGNREEGHYDLVAALKYLCRNIQRDKNPYPVWWTHVGSPGGPPAGSWVSPKKRKAKSMGLYTNTPITRKLMKKKGGF